MSFAASKWAWKVGGVSMAQKLILLSLADRANEQDECWPSIKRLMDDTGINNKRTIIKNIRAMEGMGLLVAIREHGCSNRYRLLGVQACDASGGKSATSVTMASCVESATTAKSATSGKSAPTASGTMATSAKSATSSKSAPRSGGKSATGVVAKVPPESINNLSLNLSLSNAREGVEVLPEPELAHAVPELAHIAPELAHAVPITSANGPSLDFMELR